MSWQQATEGDSGAGQTSVTGSQVGAFLTSSVHAEVDGAHIDPIDVLLSANGGSVYAVAAVQGPLRAYLATAWGTAGHAGSKKIVSYPSLAEARAAAAEVVRQRLAGEGGGQQYAQIGRYTADSAAGAGG